MNHQRRYGGLLLIVCLLANRWQHCVGAVITSTSSFPSQTRAQQWASSPQAPRGGSNARGTHHISRGKNDGTSNTGEMTRSLTIPQRLLAGGSARALSQMILYPIDALRTLAQTRDGRTLADVGVSALVRGCATTSSFAMVVGVVQFAIFGSARSNGVGPVLASALAAAGSCVASVPQEVIKQRLVTGIYPTFRSAVRTIWETEGLGGFYSSWRPTVARNVPFVIVCFTSADVMKKRIGSSSSRRDGEQGGKRSSADGAGGSSERQLSVVQNILVGISSAVVAGFVTQPVDVVKTRMMTQAASVAVPYKNAWDCARTIVSTEGISTLWSGLVQRSCYMGPLWAIQFAVNGRVSKALEKRNTRRMEEGQSSS